MKNPRSRSALAILVFFALVWYLIDSGLTQQLLSLSVRSWVASGLLGWSIMILSSWIVFIARLGILPPTKTLLLFPICQSLAGLIFPFQGSLSFTSIYFKYIHHLDISQTIGVNALLLVSYVLLLGLSGLSLSYAYNSAAAIWTFALISVIPVIILMISIAVKRHEGHLKKNSIIATIVAFFIDVQSQWPTLLRHPTIAGVYAARLVLYLIWFIFLGHALEANLSIHQLLYLVFAVEASLIFKITPGNWGVSQASGGAALALIEAPVADGVLLITVSMLSVLLLNLALGYAAVRQFTLEFALKKKTNLYREIARQQSTSTSRH